MVSMLLCFMTSIYIAFFFFFFFFFFFHLYSILLYLYCIIVICKHYFHICIKCLLISFLYYFISIVDSFICIFRYLHSILGLNIFYFNTFIST